MQGPKYEAIALPKVNFTEIAAAVLFYTLRALVLSPAMADRVLCLSAKSAFSQDFPDYFVNRLSI